MGYTGGPSRGESGGGTMLPTHDCMHEHLKNTCSCDCVECQTWQAYSRSDLDVLSAEANRLAGECTRISTLRPKDQNFWRQTPPQWGGYTPPYPITNSRRLRHSSCVFSGARPAPSKPSPQSEILGRSLIYRAYVEELNSVCSSEGS